MIKCPSILTQFRFAIKYIEQLLAHSQDKTYDYTEIDNFIEPNLISAQSMST